MTANERIGLVSQLAATLLSGRIPTQNYERTLTADAEIIKAIDEAVRLLELTRARLAGTADGSKYKTVTKADVEGLLEKDEQDSIS